MEQIAQQLGQSYGVTVLVVVAVTKIILVLVRRVERISYKSWTITFGKAEKQ